MAAHSALAATGPSFVVSRPVGRALFSIKKCKINQPCTKFSYQTWLNYTFQRCTLKLNCLPNIRGKYKKSRFAIAVSWNTNACLFQRKFCEQQLWPIICTLIAMGGSSCIHLEIHNNFQDKLLRMHTLLRSFTGYTSHPYIKLKNKTKKNTNNEVYP